MGYVHPAQFPCPHCGASLSCAPGTEFIKCQYCQNTSFIHAQQPHQAPPPAFQLPPPPMPVVPPVFQQRKPRSGFPAIFLLLFFGFDAVIIAVVAVVVIIGRSHPTSFEVPTPPDVPQPGSPNTPTQPTSLGSRVATTACGRAIRCCKTVQPSNAGCDGMAFMDDKQCETVFEGLKQAAQAQGKRCD